MHAGKFMNITVVILAAGQGKRMCSLLPKVLHPIGGTPMLSRVANATMTAFPQLTSEDVAIVIGHGAEQVKSALGDIPAQWVLQREQLGTGHAVKQAILTGQRVGVVIVLYGDVPLIRPETLKLLAETSRGEALALLTVNSESPFGYGRIVRDEQDNIKAIVEERDATPEQQAIKEIHTGIMAIPEQYLQKWLNALSNDNAQGEYYLTDIVAMAVAENIPVTSCQPFCKAEVQGVNDRQQQACLEREYQRLQCEALMKKGVTLLDPLRTDIRGELEAGSDVVIDTNCIFEGQVTLGNNISIGAGCIIRNASIGDNTTIAPYSLIDESQVEDNCFIGPFARLRPGTFLEQSAKIGNFVETKKSMIGEGSKINHLSYVGDTEIGKQVNIGAGTITCNYDGKNKHKTVIEDGAFIGSNTALVAPLNIGEDSTIGAGSTITHDVGKKQLSVSRGSQRNIEGWKRPEKQEVM